MGEIITEQYHDMMEESGTARQNGEGTHDNGRESSTEEMIMR